MAASTSRRHNSSAPTSPRSDEAKDVSGDRLHHVCFPGETEQYRRARDRLLRAEIELRQMTEAVAEQRRSLPRGGTVPCDYVFDEGNVDSDTVRQVRLSGLFENGTDVLLLYSFMYGPDDDAPCPLCTSFMDAIDGELPHITQRINFVAVTRGPIERFTAHARRRGWTNLKILSSSANTFNVDYHAEDGQGGQRPIAHVFARDQTGIYHCYSSELLFAPTEPGQSPRHVDSMWPLWNVFDLTPIGRGTDWWPQLDY
jgi:predicted dithiol-disulfide oxidoreductase (DUF899 family)